MSSVKDQPMAIGERAYVGRARGPWTSMAVTVSLSILLFAAGGFLLGTVQGDIPWPATPAEETVYYAGRYFAWGAAALAFVGAAAVTIISKARSMTAGLGWGWGWGILTIAASGLLGVLVFFSVYAVGQDHYLSAFS